MLPALCSQPALLKNSGPNLYCKSIRLHRQPCRVHLAGIQELRVLPEEIRGKRILLKANIVEPHRGSEHIVTNPAVVFAAAETFLKLGAERIFVAEGAGHCRDTYQILEESGFDAIFGNPKITFVDLNYDDWLVIPNSGGRTNLKSFIFPATLKKVDWIVSMPKLKTHHWAGATLSMKNLFGSLPGTFYGWAKNVLHNVGITESINDLNSTLHPQFAIVDGIIGMEGDGPIMGSAKNAGVLVMGRNLPAWTPPAPASWASTRTRSRTWILPITDWAPLTTRSLCSAASAGKPSEPISSW